MFEGVLQLLGSGRAAFLPILPGNDAAPCVTRNCKETHVRAGRQPRMHKSSTRFDFIPCSKVGKGLEKFVCSCRALMAAEDTGLELSPGHSPEHLLPTPQPCPCWVWGEQSPVLTQPVALQPRCPQAQRAGDTEGSLGVTPCYQPCQLWLGQAQVAP